MKYKTVAPKDAQYIDYRQLQPFQGDLKDLSAENYDKLLKSFEEDGFFVPVFVWKHKDINYLLDGHGRKRVLDNEKIEFENTGFEIPCYYIPGDDYKQAKKRLLKITSQYQTITQEGIDSYIAEADLDEAEVYEATAFDANIGKYTEEPEVEEDEAPEVSDEPPVSKLGEIYQLGRHRVMCADSTVKENVELLMNGEKADMVFTDPPYGMDLDTDYSKMPSTKEEGNRTYSPVIGDDKPFNHQDFHWIDCKEQIWFGANYYAKTLPDGGSWLVWDKRVEEKFDRMFGSGFEIAWSKTPHKQKIYRHNNTLFGGDSEAIGKEHPTQKPTKLCSEIIKDFGNDSDKVLDLFGGSGSTLIACEQTGRTCYGMEISEQYVDVVRRRYHKFVTGSEEGWEDATPKVN